MKTRWLLCAVAGFSLLAAIGCKGPAAKRAEAAAKEKELQDRLTTMESSISRLGDQVSDLKDRPAPMPEPVTIQPEKADSDFFPSDTPKVTRSGSGGGSKSGLAKKHIRCGASVKQVQAALKRAGFNPGPVDGVCGERTIAAIRAFQAKEGLKVDGVCGQQTWARLSK